ncbi:hypothetical protein DYB30_003213 [Aphanomyces astaci]|uniref:Glutaredoxin domain-containing protein n=2 Tax=Aphanomyces astaci TaxID=112090 RepID=A0A397BME7_APHAT|nr:hypothetical protein DYB36_010625 [Aphanomyces astaci]RHY57392.1 hypothetical protein DYB38_009945 [Aphanomyces astaci]RHY61880.1 hypothetical protein DYB30_003213 [Aphanomyces astaci]RHZ17235.1 hypothetical protein DYB31_009202 [Aphanomyces astaci]
MSVYDDNRDTLWHCLTTLFSPPPTLLQRKAEAFVTSRLRHYNAVLFVETATETFGCVVADVLRRARRTSHCIVNLDEVTDPALLREIRAALAGKSGYWTLPVLFLNGRVVPQVGAIRDA